MNLHVVTEGPFDAALLSTLLAPEAVRSGVCLRFREAGGWSAADSLARSILAVRREPVVLVVDADGGEERASERKAFLQSSLGAVARPDMFEVVVMAPALEMIFFQDESVLEHIAGRPPTDVERVRAEYEPVRALESMGVKRDRIPQSLRPEDVERLRAMPELQRILAFVHGWIERSQDAKVAV
jgi:hypothetical protein